MGLLLPGEITDIKQKILLAALTLEECVDMTSLIAIMNEAKPIKCKAEIPGPYAKATTALTLTTNADLTLAVAYDDAFCFYYKDNLELFEKNGVRIRYFSPLKDEHIPEDEDGLLFGGWYPENHLPALSRNTSMLASVKNAIENGIPSLAECGGFMYLHKAVTDREGNRFEMVGACDGECSYAGRLVRFGYLEIRDIYSLSGDDALLKSMIGIRGHEFHYYDSTVNGDALLAEKPDHSRAWNCMVCQNNGIWGFPHFYYYSKPEFIRCFIQRMLKEKGCRQELGM